MNKLKSLRSSPKSKGQARGMNQEEAPAEAPLIVVPKKGEISQPLTAATDNDVGGHPSPRPIQKTGTPRAIKDPNPHPKLLYVQQENMSWKNSYHNSWNSTSSRQAPPILLRGENPERSETQKTAIVESAYQYLTKNRGFLISRENFETQMASPVVLCYHAESKIEVMIVTLDSTHQFSTQGTPIQSIFSTGRGMDETTTINFQKTVFNRDWSTQATPYTKEALLQGKSCGYIRGIENTHSGRTAEMD